MCSNNDSLCCLIVDLLSSNKEMHLQYAAKSVIRPTSSIPPVAFAFQWLSIGKASSLKSLIFAAKLDASLVVVTASLAMAECV